MSTRRELRTIALLTLAALAYRTVLILSVDRIVWGDEPFYLWLGRNWLTGQGYTFTGYSDVHHTPLFPLLSGLVYLVVGDLQIASNVVYVICGALFTIPIYLIGYEMYGRRAALLAAVLASVWPAVTLSVLHWGTMTEPPYLLFIYSGIYCGLLTLRGKGFTLAAPTAGATPVRRWALPPLFCGAFVALAYLTRPEAIGYLVAIVGVIVIVRVGEGLAAWRTRLRHQRRSWREHFAGQSRSHASLLRTSVALGLIVLGYMLFFFPYAYYVRQHTGEWMVSEKAGVTYVTSKSLAYGDTATFDRLTWGLDSAGTEVFFFSPESYNVSIVEVIQQDPWDFARLVYTNVRRFADSLLSIRLFPYWLILLVGVGWLKQPWTRDRLKAELFLLGAISPVLGFLVFFIQDRYILAIVPGLIIWAANGLAVVQEWLEETVGNLASLRNSGRRPGIVPGTPTGTPPGTMPGLQAPPALLRTQLPLQRDESLAIAFTRTLATVVPILLVLGYLAATAPSVLRAAYTGSWRWEHRSIGLWLRDNTDAGGIVMARYPAMAFYADKRWVPTPNAPVADAMRYARIKNAAYWVVDERETLKLRPQFAPLAQGDTHPGLELLHSDTSSKEKIAVYTLPGDR